MQLMERILVAVEFDTTLSAVLARASFLAQRFGAELVLTHALEHLGHRDEAVTRLTRLSDELRQQGLAVARPVVHHGTPFSVILSTANAFDVNLILMGARDLGIGGRLFHGVTANKVMHRAVMPVWLVRPGAATSTALTRVLCPTDFSPASDQALRSALHLARTLGAALQVLHVAPIAEAWLGRPGEEGPAPGGEPGRLKSGGPEGPARLREAFDRYLQRFDFKSVNVTSTLRHGKVQEHILDLASQCQVIVMGAVGRSSVLAQFIGNNTDRVIRSAPCSVIVVRHQDLFKVMHEHALLRDSEQRFTARVIEESVNDLANFIEQHYQAGQELLDKGFLEDAIVEFRLCLDRDHLFTQAYEGIAEACERMGNNHMAQQYLALARDHRRLVWQMKAQSEAQQHHASLPTIGAKTGQFERRPHTVVD
jgi:nucleotide-binding universal stress UspA family protein